jgi:hypothetical protein
MRNCNQSEDSTTLLCPSSLTSLDDSIGLAYASLRKLAAAESVDVTDVIRQFREADRAASEVRALVLAQDPYASWENRAELETLIAAGPRKRDESRWSFRFLRWARER